MAIRPAEYVRGFQSPKMFARYFDRIPGRFEAPNIAALHREIFTGISRRLGTLCSVTGVQEFGLSPVIPNALPLDEFKSVAGGILEGAEKIDFERMAALNVTRRDADDFAWDCFYSLHGLNNLSRIELRHPGRHIVHEICGSLYGHIFERMSSADMPKKVWTEMSVVSEGWAALFSQDPSPTETLLSMEMILAKPERYRLDAEQKNALEVVRTDRHNFASLALFKIEAAYGLGRLAELMLKPPGFVEDGEGLRLENVFDSLIGMYYEANSVLSQAPIPREQISTEFDFTK